jgi:hypothetical protein
MSYLPPLLRDLFSEMLDAEADIEGVTSLRQDADLAAELVLRMAGPERGRVRVRPPRGVRT